MIETRIVNVSTRQVLIAILGTHTHNRHTLLLTLKQTHTHTHAREVHDKSLYFNHGLCISLLFIC